MQKKDCFFLGKIIKKYSYKGEVIIKLDTDEPELYSNLKSAFIELDGILTPFFLKHCIVQHNNNLRVLFEDFSFEQVDKLIGSEVFLPLGQLPTLSDNQFYYHEITGFKVIDLKYGEVGYVKQVQDYDTQAFLEIKKNKRNILIPINDYFIIGIDKSKKIIRTKTPDGLLDL